jgi:hypothetical protein
MALLNFFRSGLFGFFTYLGQVALLAWETFCSIFAGRIRFKLTLFQIAEWLRLSAYCRRNRAFTGAVFTASLFSICQSEYGTAVGPVVTLSMFRDLGRLTGLW